MSRSLTTRKLTLTLANLLLPVAVLVFAVGFFPYKPVLPGLAVWEEEDGDGNAGGGGGGSGRGGTAPFDRVVFMVVDALRSDFVYGRESGMGFVQSLIRSGAAIPFTAHATPPTVTMPRVKALTTGSVPSFLDLILNFAESDTSSSLALQDTWLAQIRAQSVSGNDRGDGGSTREGQPGQLVFYGDDTWLKLFPTDWFARHDGTSSFFVSDFTEVDNNVTRHIPSELARGDWDAMIMHYLGLDHIGHKTGPQGPNMLPKQKEMDGIVGEIYQAMERREELENTLLVLAGDHGMNAGGNHGGSGPGETEPALLFASPKFREMRKSMMYEAPTLPKDGTEFHYYTKVEQSDLVPTLAGLMGFPVPKNSLGVFVPELVCALGGTSEELAVLRRNARQMTRIVEATYGEERFTALAKKFEASDSTDCHGQAEGEYELACLLRMTQMLEGRIGETEALLRYMYAIQETLSSTASSYGIPQMVGGMAVSALSLVLSTLAFSQLWPPTPAGSFLAALTLLYGIMMFASSYVEEEQHFWYWLTPLWLGLLAVKEFRSTALNNFTLPNGFSIPRAALLGPVLAAHRLMIRWNQTGQKHAGEPDIVHSFFPEHHVLLWLLILATYVYVGLGLSSKSFKHIMSGEAAVSTAAAMVLPAVVFKLNFTQADAPELVRGLGEGIRGFTNDLDLVVQARVVFVMLAIAVGIAVVGSSLMSAKPHVKGMTTTLTDRLHPLLTLFLLTQTRAPNVPLFLLLELQRELLALICAPSAAGTTTSTTDALTTAITSLLFSQTTYFAFGGSNSISSIDLSNAYNGVADYNIVAVGVLLFASNWAGAVWWCSAAVTLLLPRSRGSGPGSAGRKAPRKDGLERSWVQDERARLLDEVMGPAKAEAEVVKNGERQQERWFTYVAAMSVFIAGSLLAVMAACTALRTHLFIWTVFSPKYLYAMAWAVGWHLMINVAFGNLLWWLGSVR